MESVVQEIYKKANHQISDVELANEILNHSKLTALDFWLLPQYPFNQWRRKYEYPQLVQNIKTNNPSFVTWMKDQGITEEYLVNGYISDFLDHKALSENNKKYLIQVSYEGKISLQSWHKYNGEKSSPGNGEPVIYEFIKEYISYYDWLKLNGTEFNFTETFHRYDPNTPNEQVYLNHNYKLLKMGGMEPPTNSVGILLRGKRLEFVNVSGLEMSGTIYFGSMGNLSFDHCAVDNLKCNELEIPRLDFQYCSVKNIQIRNSKIENWLFVGSNTTGNIIDTKLSRIRIYGGQFAPTFTNSEIDEVRIDHKLIPHDKNFEKTYRSLSKSAKESGNGKLARQLKIKEFDFIKNKQSKLTKFFMTLDKLYWGYGQNPRRLILIAIGTIFLFGILFSFFPENFKGEIFVSKPYWRIFYNTQYYSAVTFTTLGYGDLSPTGFLKLLAAFEAIFGATTLGFLVAGLTRNE